MRWFFFLVFHDRQAGVGGGRGVTACTASWTVCMLCMLLPPGWVSSNSASTLTSPSCGPMHHVSRQRHQTLHSLIFNKHIKWCTQRTVHSEYQALSPAICLLGLARHLRETSFDITLYNQHPKLTHKELTNQTWLTLDSRLYLVCSWCALSFCWAFPCFCLNLRQLLLRR